MLHPRPESMLNAYPISSRINVIAITIRCALKGLQKYWK